MARTILYIATSLDGYIAGKNDDISWLDPYVGVNYEFDKFKAGIGALIEGRRTFDIELKGGYVGFHKLPAFVLTSNPPSEKPENYFFISGSPKDTLRQVKTKAGRKDIWLAGGGRTAQEFLAAGCVDQIILTLVPVLIGRGIRLFDPSPDQYQLSLEQVRQFEKGLVQLVYTAKLGRGD